MKKLLCSLLFVAHGALAQDGLTLGTGIHYSEGDYGTGTDTTIFTVPLTARYGTGPWSLRLWVPYIEIDGATSVVPGVGSVRRGPVTRSRTESGLGDVVASATYAAYYDAGAQLGIDVTGKVKLGTADADRGLGTGEDDFAALVEVFKTFDRVTAFVGVGHHWLGSSAAIPLDNVLSWSLGGTYRIDDRDSAGLIYDGRERVAPGAGELSELTAFWSRRLSREWKAQVYVLKGFANGSPDWGAGLSAAYAF